MAPSGPRQTLLLFCKFLTHRVRAEHLDQLYNIALEFLESPPCFTHVDEMLYRVFPLVAVLSIETTDEFDSDSHGADDEDVNELRELGVAIKDRVAVKNWDLLERIYSEFKMGSDHALRAFVSLQPQAIAILQVGLCEPLVQDAMPATSRLKMISVTRSNLDEVDVPKPRSVTSQPLASSPPDSASDVMEIVRILRAEQTKIETTTPWKSIFHLVNITYPFDEKKYPKIARKFVAHVVWERAF